VLHFKLETAQWHPGFYSISVATISCDQFRHPDLVFLYVQVALLC
jgi:hypothetical protein